MGFTSLDQLAVSMSTGQKERYTWQKATSNAATSAAGRWHELFTANGVPAAGAFAGTAGAATAMNRSTSGALPLGNDVSPMTRHLTNLAANATTATIVPGSLVLCDFLLYYPSCVVTGTATTLNNTVTLPRYTDGAGVQAIAVVQTALGAAAPALTITYTDQDGNTGNTALALTSPAASAPVSTLFAYNFGPFAPLAGTDKGMRKIDSYTIATGTTGTVAFLLVRPLAQIPLLAATTMSMMNLVHEFPSLEQVQDNACLGFLLQCGGAMTASAALNGWVETAWA